MLSDSSPFTDPDVLIAGALCQQHSNFSQHAQEPALKHQRRFAVKNLQETPGDEATPGSRQTQSQNPESLSSPLSEALTRLQGITREKYDSYLLYKQIAVVPITRACGSVQHIKCK